MQRLCAKPSQRKGDRSPHAAASGQSDDTGIALWKRIAKCGAKSRVIRIDAGGTGPLKKNGVARAGKPNRCVLRIELMKNGLFVWESDIQSTIALVPCTV